MATATVSSPITLEEFLRLSDATPEGETLELIEGELRTRPMTTRRPTHSAAFVQTSRVLANWLEAKEIAGCIAGGEARCRLTSDPETIVGIDVAVWFGEEFEDLAARQPLFDAPPTIAVELLSGSDTHEAVIEKLDLYLRAGVRQVWIADPDLLTVTIHRNGREPEFFTASQTLTAEPELPGFQVEVRRLFQAKKRAK